MSLSRSFALQETAPAPAERRRHRRVSVKLPGRYMLENRQEFACESIDISAGGILLRAPLLGAVGDRVVVYLDLIGRLEGRITRHTREGFALALQASEARRERLIDHLTWLANREAMGIPPERRHDRIVPTARDSQLRLEHNVSVPCRIIDVSMSGAAVEMVEPPPIGTAATIGSTPGRVIRHIEGGIGIEFLRLLPMDMFDESIVL